VPTVPFRDVMLPRMNAAAVRATASDTIGQYPVNDAEGRTVAVSVSTACTVSCTHANPQSIASFLGTLPHRGEISLLTVQLVEPELEMTAICGPGALACYFYTQNRMVINGNDTTAPDGATRDFVVAHEYGHHLANHRNNAPFEPTIDYGPKRWGTYERVCEGGRSGFYFPGDQGDHYYENPGEAFAEAFAFNRFPTSPVQWAWIASLRPDARAFAAINQDATNPWTGRTRVTKRGEVPRRKTRRRFATPLDGTLTLKLSGPFQADLELVLRDLAGRTLGRSDGLGSKERVGFTICGEAAVRAIVKRTGSDDDGRFKLTAIRP
jgi:hypothetical protein